MSSPHWLRNLIRLEPNQVFHNSSLPPSPISFFTLQPPPFLNSPELTPSAHSTWHIRAYAPVLRGKGSFHPFLKSLECHAEKEGWGSGEGGQFLRFTLQVGGLQPLSEVSFGERGLSWLIRSKYSLCQIITLFLRQLQNLLYQLARSPAAAIYLCLSCASIRKGLPGAICGASEGRAGGRERSRCFGQGQAGGGRRGALRGTGERAGSSACAPAPAAGALLSAGATPAPDVAQEDEPTEPGVGTRRLGCGQDPGSSAEENAGQQPRCPRVLTRSVGVRPAVAFSGKAWQGKARFRLPETLSRAWPREVRVHGHGGWPPVLPPCLSPSLQQSHAHSWPGAQVRCSDFWSQDPFTILKIIKDPEELLFM